MSYEGFEQQLCVNNHYRCFNCYDIPNTNLCTVCNDILILNNLVDQTNYGVNIKKLYDKNTNHIRIDKDENGNYYIDVEKLLKKYNIVINGGKARRFDWENSMEFTLGSIDDFFKNHDEDIVIIDRMEECINNRCYELTNINDSKTEYTEPYTFRITYNLSKDKLPLKQLKKYIKQLYNKWDIKLIVVSNQE
jgi:hypothetical protein